MTLELQIEGLESKQLDTSFLYVIGRGNKVGEVQLIEVARNLPLGHPSR